MQERQKWVYHKFETDIDLAWMENEINRISDTALRLELYTNDLTETSLSINPKGRWSIKQHIGHLTDLESLWADRFEQFEQRRPELVAADMTNQKTKASDHNDTRLELLVKAFEATRTRLIKRIRELSDDTQAHQAFHPRIKQMMRPVDLVHFIAEHDNHHLTSIRQLVDAIGLESRLEKYMVVEKFKEGKIKSLYKHLEDNGRMLPSGVHYINSWIDKDVKSCFQLMASESKTKLEFWIKQWSDFADFEIIPLISSAEASNKVLKGND